MAEARIGKVTSINYKKGMARVTYADKDKNVTQELPFLAGEYNMPEINQQVLVLHLTNGNEMGIIIGTLWSNKSKPVDENDKEYGKEGVYRKNFTVDRKNYIMWDPDKEELTIKAKTIVVDGNVIKKSGSADSDNEDTSDKDNEDTDEEDKDNSNEDNKDDKEDEELEKMGA